MSDDLNTSPLLTGAFQEALKLINSSLGMLKKKQQLSLIRSLAEIKKEVMEVLKILGHFPRTCYEIRTDLSAKGIALMDEGKETFWRPCIPVEKEEQATTAVEELMLPPQSASS
ncbi:hypothetical protein NC653_021115 [Populus alba x Populus x berolinensis]|uniref:Uncharacterized protein n=1 Tax=Populus alba x Populus x berolinensis TaxID=444605 RepID=A0AAD6QDF6_9ROSI|nr:hypothetical protein NC653_021115 [Populus alba x Populus x berolinensis]